MWLQLETQLDYAKFQKEVWTNAVTYKWKTFRDPSIRRQFKVLSVLGRAALPDDKLKEVSAAQCTHTASRVVKR